MNKKRIASLILCTVLSCSLFNSAVVFAQDDSGKIDLYEAFSSKADMMKTEVGSRIYKWSMHLPDDGIIYKSDKANYFDMQSTSYNASISLSVEKNEDNLSLEEVLYKLQSNNSNNPGFFYYFGDKEYVTEIATDEKGQKYIKIIKTNEFYDYYYVSEAAAKESSYDENRIYIANNYIYNLTVSMDGQSYKKHQEMFDKLTSSFKLSFDESNPYIKELSDSVSSIRLYENSSYGWNIMMSPYWRIVGNPNARNQNFSPVYSDEELNNDKQTQKSDEEEMVQEGISVRLVSSAETGETAASWSEKESNKIKNNYNSQVYDVLKSESKQLNGLDTYNVITRYKTITDNPYVVHNMYVIGNGYKYLVTAVMKEEKYNSDKKNDFENMISSFKLDSKGLNKYLGKLISADSLVDANAVKEFKMEKYDFISKLTKSWSSPGDNYYGDGYYYEDYFVGSDFGKVISNRESLNVTDAVSNITVAMNAGLDTSKIEDALKMRVAALAKDDEVSMGLARVRIKTAEYDGAQLYYIEKEYDLNAINSFVKNDTTKRYDLTNLHNEYEYMVKIDKDTYTQTVALPVANSTAINKIKAADVWNNTTIKQKNYSVLNIEWKNRDIEEFNDSKVDSTAGVEDNVSAGEMGN